VNRRWNLRRTPAWAALALVGSSLLGVGVGIDAAADDAPTPITLKGQGDSDLIAELVSFQNALYEADQPTDMSYFNIGSAQGRKNLLSGKADFILSGVPFTAAELAGRAAGAGAIIDVPLSVAALSVVVTTPPQIGWQTVELPTDPSCGTEDEDPTLCAVTYGTFEGPFRVPADNLSAMIVGLALSATNNLQSWANPAWEAALGTSAMTIQTSRLNAHTWVNRSEASSQNSALLTYVSSMSPDVWSARLAQDSAYPWKPNGEQMSPATKPTKQGTDQVAGAITFATLNPFSNTGFTYGPWTGNAGAVPVTYVGDLKEDFPKAGLQVMEIQNHLGEWVSPNRASIEAALAADPNGMDIAATQDVAGGYPLVYINHLYTVAGTLAPDKANALAAFVRYAVTDGQDEVVNRGGAPLTAAQVTQALAAADQIVTANCTATGYEVTTSGPSALEPNTPKVQALASMRHCTLAPVPTTTTSTTTTTIADTTTTVADSTTTTSTTSTVAATSTTALVASESPTGSSGTTSYTPSYTPTYTPTYTPSATTPAVVSTDEEPTADTAVEDTTTTIVVDTTIPPETTAVVAAATGGPGTHPRGVALTALPMVSPDDGSAEYKKLGTLFLGAALFLFGRRLVHARRPAVS